MLKHSLSLALLTLCGGVFAANTTVQVTTKFKGTAPKATAIRMNADPECARQNKDKVVDESFVIDDKGNLGNVFVYIKEGMAPVPTPKDIAPLDLDQKGCVYRPHVLGVRVGQPLNILNSDHTLHNVHSASSSNPSFNIGMANQGKLPQPKRFDKPEVMIRLKCDVHGWMHAYIGVVDHPYFGVSDKGGRLALKELPPGNYTVEAWHERLGVKTAKLAVDEKGGVKKLEFVFEKKD